MSPILVITSSVGNEVMEILAAFETLKMSVLIMGLIVPVVIFLALCLEDHGFRVLMRKRAKRLSKLVLWWKRPVAAIAVAGIVLVIGIAGIMVWQPWAWASTLGLG